MPQISLESIRRPSQTIDGIAEDITDRQDLDADSLSLAGEPDFPEGVGYDRESDPIVNLPAKLPHGPLRSLQVESLNSKWQLMEQLTRTLTVNEFDLPVYVYRPDLLDDRAILTALVEFRDAGTSIAPSEHLADSYSYSYDSPHQARSDGLQDILASLTSATMVLSYHEGFPATPRGTPFWTKLDFEPAEAYNAFINYLDMGGARKLSSMLAYDIDHLVEWFHTYYWAYRVKAFDLYKVANGNRLRIQRMLEAEDSHYKMAGKIMTAIDNVLDSPNILAEKIEGLELDKLVGILEKLVKVQRISVGLTANGGDPGAPAAPTTNIIMQQITKDQGSVIREDDDMDLLMEDPEAVEMAQALIINQQKRGTL